MKTILNNNQAFAIFKQNATDPQHNFLRLHAYNKVKEGVSYCKTYKIVYPDLEPDHIYDITVNDGCINIQALLKGKNIALQLLSSSTGFYANDDLTKKDSSVKSIWSRFFSNPYKFMLTQFIPHPKWSAITNG